MTKVYRYEETEQSVNEIIGPSIFLAGPTVRGNQQHLISWRFEAIEIFRKLNFNGSLIVPEFSNNYESDKERFDLPIWEFNGLNKADIILFWIPRTRELIGLTTNFELGLWLSRDVYKVIYGRPDDAYRINYCDIMYNKLCEEKLLKPVIYNNLEELIKETILLTKLINH